MAAGFFATTAAGETFVLDELRTTPVTLGARTWTTSTGTNDHSLDFNYLPNLMLAEKIIDQHEPITYGYDWRQRVVQVQHYNNDLEAFAYDAVGNPVMSSRLGEQDWTYHTTGLRFSEIPGRSGTAGTTETYRYDGWSRMTGWRTTEPNQPELSRRMRYDGLGRLDLYESYQSGGGRDAVEYRYTADNLLVEEARWTGMQVNRILRFSGARYETDTGELLEEILPMLRLKDGSDGKWVFLDLDGHALAVFDDGGAEETFELAGVYGAKLDPAPGLSPLDYFQGQDWKLDGLHGDELDRERGLVHRGQRHALLDDGRWLQPEPLLALGPVEMLAAPRGMGPVYASANPVLFEDRGGFMPGPATAQEMEQDVKTEGPHIDKVDELTTMILRTEDGPGLVQTARGHDVEFEVTEGSFKTTTTDTATGENISMRDPDSRVRGATTTDPATGESSVALNAEDSPEVQALTLAHEMVHVLQRSVKSAGGRVENEVQARATTQGIKQDLGLGPADSASEIADALRSHSAYSSSTSTRTRLEPNPDHTSVGKFP